MQIAEQVPADTSRLFAHASPFRQSDWVGQAPGEPAAISVSQVSPGSTIPLPQRAEQSGSWALVVFLGQQPSPAVVSTISSCAHVAVQSLPLGTSRVQATPSEQSEGGQAPGSPRGMAVSQVSSGSTRPLPQRGPPVKPPSPAPPVPPSTMQGLPPQSSETVTVLRSPARSATPLLAGRHGGARHVERVDVDREISRRAGRDQRGEGRRKRDRLLVVARVALGADVPAGPISATSSAATATGDPEAVTVTSNTASPLSRRQPPPASARAPARRRASLRASRRGSIEPLVAEIAHRDGRLGFGRRGPPRSRRRSPPRRARSRTTTCARGGRTAGASGPSPRG